MNARRDVGETLVEIMLTIVIISLTITGLVASLATVANAGTAQRGTVKIDVVLRDYAEVTKAAVQGCVDGASYTVTYVPPAGFAVSRVPVATVCPPTVGIQPVPVQLTVNGPSGSRATMFLRVRTP